MKPPTVGAVTLNVGHSAWSALVEVVSAVTKYLKERNDRHGRNPLLATYITYQVASQAYTYIASPPHIIPVTRPTCHTWTLPSPSTPSRSTTPSPRTGRSAASWPGDRACPIPAPCHCHTVARSPCISMTASPLTQGCKASVLHTFGIRQFAKLSFCPSVSYH